MPSTNEHYSPWDLLPVPVPSTVDPPPGVFYNDVVKHLVKDTVRIMANGLHIDLGKVEELQHTLDDILSDVKSRIASNPHVQTYLGHRFQSQVEAYKADRKSKMRDPSSYIVSFDSSKMDHRSYFMFIFANRNDLPQPSETLPGIDIPKWDARTVGKLATSRPLLQRLLKGELVNHPIAIEAMKLRAQHKADIYNQKYVTQIQNPSVEMPEFNPGSPIQKAELFTSLGIPSEKLSKRTGKPSYDREIIEEINQSSADLDIVALTQALIDYSFANIVRTNFIEAFYTYSIPQQDGSWRLHGNMRIFGTKTFRLTSSNPNLLNMPSTGSIFSKPIKECFTAPEGKLILAIDFGALENRVIANLSKDENLSNIYLQGLDGHCMNSLYYFKEEIAKHIPLTGDSVVDAKAYYDEVENGNKELKAIRQKGKGPSFGMQYGAYPPKIASSIKCSLEEAETIFNRYHNELYPNVTKFREDYVVPTINSNSRIHMGMGCYIATDNPDKDVRTMVNSCSQFWSILTLLTINKVHQAIDEDGMESKILTISTIYDSIYYEIDNDPSVVKWLNDRLIPIMTAPFLHDQHVPNEATAEIGFDWSTMKTIPHNASINQIEEVISSLPD